MSDRESILKAALGKKSTSHEEDKGQDGCRLFIRNQALKSTVGHHLSSTEDTNLRKPSQIRFADKKSWKNPSAADLHCYVWERPPSGRRQ